MGTRIGKTAGDPKETGRVAPLVSDEEVLEARKFAFDQARKARIELEFPEGLSVVDYAREIADFILEG